MPSTTPPPRKPSILRRLRNKTSSLTSPRPRRALTDFHVSLSDPHRVYAPSSVVAGSVFLTVERALPITHLTVALVGCVDLTPSPTGKRSKDAATEGAARNVFCRDEIVLSGEGRLDPGVYEFQFELEFCKVPGIGGVGLPTSIDFEKGSICYSVISTLTRPTNTASTSTCSTLIKMTETIDIAHILPPKPRTIELNPRKLSQPSSPSTSPATSHTHLPIDTKITSTLTLLTPGVLPGEPINLSLSISHTKPIKSIHGIILTLFRQTRFDPSPLAFGAKSKSKPLNLLPPASTAASTFRKDLAQTICPLIIDPHTLATTIRASVRAPPELFPTIANIPGGNLDFRYYIEAVLDLRGKLPSALPRGSNPEVHIETDVLRHREKSLSVTRVEVVIGSVDSVGRKGRLQKAERTQRPERVPERVEERVEQRVEERVEQRVEQRAEEAPEVDEKTRCRLAEEALLPSAPPGGEGAVMAEPSAPDLAEEEAHAAPMYERLERVEEEVPGYR